MIAYKGFNSDLSCTKGCGKKKYKVGESYTFNQSKTRNSGFHATQEPLDVLFWYPDGRYCIVDMNGDISEEYNIIASTKMDILEEVSLLDLICIETKIFLEQQLQNIPNTFKHIKKNEITTIDSIGIAVGSKPKIKGEIGDIFVYCITNPKDKSDIELKIIRINKQIQNKFYTFNELEQLDAFEYI